MVDIQSLTSVHKRLKLLLSRMRPTVLGTIMLVPMMLVMLMVRVTIVGPIIIVVIIIIGMLALLIVLVILVGYTMSTMTTVLPVWLAHKILEELVTFSWPMPSLTLVALSLVVTGLCDEARWVSIIGLANHLSLEDGALANGNTDALFLDGAAVTCTLVPAVAFLLGSMAALAPRRAGAVLFVGLPRALVSAVHLAIVLVCRASACESAAA
jgi:hypothetical protein